MQIVSFWTTTNFFQAVLLDVSARLVCHDPRTPSHRLGYVSASSARFRLKNNDMSIAIRPTDEARFNTSNMNNIDLILHIAVGHLNVLAEMGMSSRHAL